jgi:hypothetical protein
MSGFFWSSGEGFDVMDLVIPIAYWTIRTFANQTLKKTSSKDVY